MHKAVRPADTEKVANLAQHPKRFETAGLNRGLQTFLSEGHISYYATVQGPDILRNVIVSDMLNSAMSRNVS